MDGVTVQGPRSWYRAGGGLSLCEKVVCLLLLPLLGLTMPLRSFGWPFGFDMAGEVAW